jgi:hypothetical protein
MPWWSRDAADTRDMEQKNREYSDPISMLVGWLKEWYIRETVEGRVGEI